MARVSEKHERYRTKAQIVKDIVHILNADVSYGTQYAVLKDASWVWTEFDGKYDGCKRWSKRARRLKKRDPKTRLLRHEHAVPRKVVFEMLKNLRSPNAKSVSRICRKFLLGVVVTKREDELLNQRFKSSMPDEFFDSSSNRYRDPWLRYEACGIQLDDSPVESTR